MSVTRERYLVLLNDDTEHEVVLHNNDKIRYEETAHKRQWPMPSQDNPMNGSHLRISFLTWAAAIRTKLVGTDVKYETWRNEIFVDFDPLDVDDNGNQQDVEADPTRTEQRSDSATP